MFEKGQCELWNRDREVIPIPEITIALFIELFV